MTTITNTSVTTSGKILYSNLYNNVADLPSASTYHGMFAHVHSTGAGYFAHGGAWLKLVHEDTNGHVTIPSQPVFSVSRTSSQATGGSYTAIQFQSGSSGTINEGGYWSFANHRFTAPVAGKYEFAWGYGTNAPAGQTVYRSYLYVNGSEYQNSQLRNDSNGSTGYVYAARSQILSLASADYVELRGRADGSQNFYADANLRIHMTGRLIG